MTDEERSSALETARDLKKKIEFMDRFPTVRIPGADQIQGQYGELVHTHGFSPSELAGEDIDTTDEQDDWVDPEEFFRSSDSAVEEEEINEANRFGRKYDYALPFKIGFRKPQRGVEPTGENWDLAGLSDTLKQRIDAGLPPNTTINPGIDPEDVAEAHAMGMSPRDYQVARELGAPHDYIKEVFRGSIRPHSVQDEEYADALTNVGQTFFQRTPFGAAMRKFRRETQQAKPSLSENTDLEASDGYVPLRISAMRPVHIGHAYREGIPASDLLEAWHANGFHPLAGHDDSDWPITSYMSLRADGAGHEESKDVLLSLSHIPHHVYSILKAEGMDHKGILDLMNERNPHYDITTGRSVIPTLTGGSVAIDSNQSMPRLGSKTKYASARDRFLSRHVRYEGRSPETARECYEMASLASDAYRETSDHRFRGLHTRYLNYGNDLLDESEPELSFTPVSENGAHSSRRKPTRADIESHPHFVSWNEDGSPNYAI